MEIFEQSQESGTTSAQTKENRKMDGMMQESMMKTQVSILVRKESLYSQIKWKLFGHWILWFLYIFRAPSGVNILIDKNQKTTQRYEELKPRKEPYVIDVEPGYHEILFEDENADIKAKGAFFLRLMGAVAGGAFFSGMGGSGMGAATDFMAGTSGTTVRDGAASFTIQAGDVLKLSCKPTRKGRVSVKVLN